MRSNDITVTGCKELQEAFDILGQKTARSVMRSAGQAGAIQIKKSVIRSAPQSAVNRESVFGGHKYKYLRKHLRQQITTTAVKAYESDVKILIHTNDAFWGLFTEKGTKKGIKAAKWMRKGLDSAKAAVDAAIEKKLVDAIIRKAGK